MIIPKIRFKNKEGSEFLSWELSSIENFVKKIHSGRSKKNTTGCFDLYGATGLIGTSNSFDCNGEFVLAARVGSIGVLNLPSGKYAVSDNTLIFEHNELTIPQFLYYRLSLFDWYSVATGTSQKVVSAGRLKKSKLFWCSLEEQQKIASFFSTLDQKIELNERKLEALEKLKKGLMQKIFSQRIRFRSDNDQSFPAWKTVKLSEISQPLTYGLNSPAKPFDGENKYLRITDIDERTNKYIQDAPVSPSAKPDNKYSLEEGDIVFARTGNSVGKTYIYQKGDGKLYYAGFLIRARINTGACPYFIFIQTLTETYKNWVRVTSQRSGQPGINAEEYGNYVLAMPSLEEQTKIASLFIHFDKKIELVLAKINSLKKLKQGFMQQMFV